MRVSTARAEQLRSLSSQVSAMTWYIYSRENWILKDIYLEVGSAKTGSSRREFTRLLDDCKSQQIEVVVVKSNPTGNRYVLHDAQMAIISTEKFAAVQKQIDKRAKRKRKAESVSSTLAEELKWDKPADNIMVKKSNDKID